MVEDRKEYEIPDGLFQGLSNEIKQRFSLACKSNELNLADLELTDENIRDWVIPFLNNHGEIIMLNVSFNRIGDEEPRPWRPIRPHNA